MELTGEVDVQGTAVAGRSYGPPRQGFFVSTSSAALVAWNVAFTLGAYHTVFYWRLFQIMVASTVLLLGALALHREIKIRPWMLVVLAVPLVWMLSRPVTLSEPRSGLRHAIDLVLFGLVAALTLPLIMLASARVLAPEFFELPGLRLKVAAAAIVAIVAVTALQVGAFNYRVVTCHDFIVAGDDTPQNCQQNPSFFR